MTNFSGKYPPTGGGGGSGTVTEVDTGTGLTGGPITTTGTIELEVPVVIANGGTNSTAALNNNRVMQSSGGAIVEAAAITASRALASDANGIPVASATTATELGYVNGVTSAIQTQLNSKQATLTPGTISTSTTGVTVGSGSSSTVGPNVTVNVQTANGSQPGLLSAADWTTFNGKQAAGNYITSLTGGVTASGPGAAAATVAVIGGVTVSGATGTTNVAFSNGPTFVAPVLGTPASGTLSNCTGFPTANLSGLGTGVATFLATPSSANLAAAVTGETGTGALVFATSPALTTPDIGTPSAGNLSNCTALPVGSVTGLGSGVATFLATPSSANLAAAVTGETGSGALVFGTAPTFTTSIQLGSGAVLSALTSGAYTPTIQSGSGGYSGLTIREHVWTQVGNIVTFSGQVNYTATSTTTTLPMDLPIARTGTSNLDIKGGLGFTNSNVTGLFIQGTSGSTTNFEVIVTSAGSGSQSIGYTASYKIN